MNTTPLLSPRFGSATQVWSVRTLLIWTSLLVLPSWIREAAAQSGQPLWKQGVSRFNGTGYDVTLPSYTPEPLSLSPYTIPTPPARSGTLKTGTNPYVPPSSGVELSSTQTPSFGLNLPDLDLSTHVQSASNVTNQLSAPLRNQELGIEPAIEPDAAIQPAVVSVDPVPTTEPPPLREEVVRWYQYPVRWMRGWNSNAEFGIDGSDGNANTLAIQTGIELKRKTKESTWSIDLDYRQANSNNVTVENNGRLNVDYDRMIADTDWSAFGKFGMEWDKFKAFDLRLNTNAGLGYHWIRSDEATLVTRFGAGASREIGAPIDEWTPEAVFGLEAERQLTRRQKLKGKIDYFPAWEDFNDYRLVTDVSWEMLLDGSENLSLKLAATDRYDSTPQGAKPNDLYYSLLLLYKF